MAIYVKTGTSSATKVADPYNLTHDVNFIKAVIRGKSSASGSSNTYWGYGGDFKAVIIGTNPTSGYIGYGDIADGGTNGHRCIASRDNSARWMEMYAGSSPYLQIYRSNGSTYGCTAWASDISLKKDISESTTDATEIIKQIPHKKFTFKEDGVTIDCGYIAQDLQKIDSRLVLEISQDDGSVRLQIDETHLIPILTKCIQELLERVEQLESKVE